MGGILFRSKKQLSRVTEQDKAVLQLKQQRDKLKQYQKKIQLQLESHRQLAKQLLAKGKTDKAKLLLRKKKFQESLLTKTDGQLDNIENMVHNIEFAQIESKVVEGLKSGNEALKSLHQILSIEDVEKIMDETAESVAYQREIDEILAGGLTAEDESDVLEELEGIIAESQPAPLEENVKLPDVPTAEIAAEKETKRKEKRQAELATAD